MSCTKDIYSIKNLIQNIPGIQTLKEKDYVAHPKNVDINHITLYWQYQ